MKGGHTPIHIMRWAPADFVNDAFVKLLVARRDFVTFTFYSLVLNWSHIEGGDLPSDPEHLAAVLGMTRRDVEKSLRICLGAGKLDDEDGRLYHKRVRRQIADEMEFRKEQAKHGQKGGRRRSISNDKGEPKATLSGDSGRPLTPPTTYSPASTPAPSSGASAYLPTHARDGDAPPTPATPSEAREVALARLGPNPHVDRDRLIAEGNRLIPIIGRLADLDPSEVISKATRWKNGSYINLAAIQSDDRLAHAVNALRTWERKLTGKAEPEVPQPPAQAAPVNERAEQRLRSMTAMAIGGMRDRRAVAGGDRGAAGRLPGSGSGREGDGETRGDLPPGTGSPDE